MGAVLQTLGNVLAFLFGSLRRVILTLLIIGLPIFIYLAFIAKEPVFSVESDVDLGMQTVTAIAEDPEQYPILPEDEYPEVYAHMRGLVDRLVQSPAVKYRDIFEYDKVKIIHDDEVLNAFCVPGGFIYVFTGLMRYIDHEDHLAGVLGHEIAHAELRHSSLRLQKQYGVEKLSHFVLLSAPLSMGDIVNAEILKDLLARNFSRDQEAQADDFSVRYLADSGYACDGTAGFFEKLLAEGQDVRIPEFLSDHPASESRVAAIRQAARDAGCSTALGDASDWWAIQAMLPPVEED